MNEDLTKKSNGWNEWAHRVLGDIERIDSKLEKVLMEISSLHVDIAILKTKAALIGAIWGGVLALFVSLIVSYIKSIHP